MDGEAYHDRQTLRQVGVGYPLHANEDAVEGAFLDKLVGFFTGVTNVAPFAAVLDEVCV